MRRSLVRRLSGLVLLAMLIGLIPVVAAAAGEWQKTGKEKWLTKGINLTTGGEGTDLVFKGDSLRAEHGLQILSDSRWIDYDLVPPADGYTESVSTMKATYSRLIVRLADGGYAQVRLGMASSSGFIYTGIFLEEWVVQKGSVPPAAPKAEQKPRGEVKLKLNSPQAEGNGVKTTLDVVPQVVAGQVMLPLRYVAETLGLKTVWDAREQKVTITGTDLTLTLWVGKSTAQLNGKAVTLTKAPSMVQNRLMVPLQVGEQLAGKASYHAATGAITLGAPGASTPPPADGQTPPPTKDPVPANWPVHFGAVWINGYGQDGLISSEPSAMYDFHLTLNQDGTARAIVTITALSFGMYLPMNLEYKGTYTRNPFRADLKLQPALKGYDTLEHGMPGWQQLTVSGTLPADMSKIETLRINDKPAKATTAVPVKRMPDPGKWRYQN